MIIDGFAHQLPDIDPQETAEWLDSLASVVDSRGRPRAQYLLARLIERSRELAVGTPASVSTPVRQHDPARGGAVVPGRLRARAPHPRLHPLERGGHGGPGQQGGGRHRRAPVDVRLLGRALRGRVQPLLPRQGGRPPRRPRLHPGPRRARHLRPGLPGAPPRRGRPGPVPPRDRRADRRAALDGRGLSSYPHPRLMPDFWEYPTVSMGLGPILSIYQARFNKYLHNRRIDDALTSPVWCFLGDGEVDEPETLGAISLAAREQLDNLTWVVNCNLQRLDGPVRGNGKVIQELEAIFRGSGWNVIKVVWGSGWDELLARDVDGVLLNKMNSTLDGEFQRYAIEPGSYIRENFFGPDPRLRAMVEHLSDEDLQNLPRGGHDYQKLYAAYQAAVETKGVPTVILAKTIKGWTLGLRLRGPQLHAPDQEDDRGAAHGAARPPPPGGGAAGLGVRGRPAAVRAPAARLPRHRVPARPTHVRSTARCRRARCACGDRSSCPRTRCSTSCSAAPADRRRRPPRRSPDCCATCAATRRSAAADRADHPRRGTHLRHGRAVQGARHLLGARAELRAGRPRPAAVLQGVDRRADPRGGHQRGRRSRRLDRRGHQLRAPAACR